MIHIQIQYKNYVLVMEILWIIRRDNNILKNNMVSLVIVIDVKNKLIKLIH